MHYNMAVSKLERCAFQTIINCLTGEDSPSPGVKSQFMRLIQLFDHGSWGEECLAVLERLVKYYKSKVTPMCSNLECLDISDLGTLSLNKMQLFSIECGHKYKSLTSVDLHKCSQVTDFAIQNLLRNAPSLQSLNISRCNISDQVFLIDQVKQLAREASIKIIGLTDDYDSCLQHVDVSRCKNITSTCIRHLCTLCGPTLRSVNLTRTKVDCAALLYLSGLSLPSAVHLFVTFRPPVYTLQEFVDTPDDVRYYAVAYALHEFEDLSKNVKQLVKWAHKEHASQDLNIEANKEVQLLDCPVNRTQELNSYGPCREGQRPDGRLSLRQDAGVSSGHSSPGESTGHFSPLLVNTQLLKDQSNSNSDQSILDKKHHGLVDQLFSASKGAKNKLHTTNKKQSFASVTWQNTNSDFHLPSQKLSITSFFNLYEIIQKTYEENKMIVIASLNTTVRLNVITLQGDPAKTSLCDVGSSDAANVPLYSPGITSLCASEYVFDEENGQWCFEKFLSGNPSLVTLKMFGGDRYYLVTDEMLKAIAAQCRDLTSISLEGCGFLSNAAVAKLVQCTKLTDIDLSGLYDISDLTIQFLVDNLPLSSLQLNSTQINNNRLQMLASKNAALRLRDLDLLWCDDFVTDKGLNEVARCCTNLQRLFLEDCFMTPQTVRLLAQNCHKITELNISSITNAVDDTSLIMLSENLPLLEIIQLDRNYDLTNTSVTALLVNCPRLSFVGLERLQKITSDPFLNIISVPTELKNFLRVLGEKQMNKSVGDLSPLIYPKISDLPCLPHRSTTYCTELQILDLHRCYSVEERYLQSIVSVAKGSLEIINYHGEIIVESPAVLETYINRLFLETVEVLSFDMDLWGSTMKS